MGLGPLELLIVLAIVLLLFGGRRLPQLGRQLGGGLREFKESVTRRSDDGGRDARIGAPEDDDRPLDGELVSDRR